MSSLKVGDSPWTAGLELAFVRGSMGVCVSMLFVFVQATALLGLEHLSTRSRGVSLFPSWGSHVECPTTPTLDRSSPDIPQSCPMSCPLLVAQSCGSRSGMRLGDPKCARDRTPNPACILRPLSCPQASWEGGWSCMACDHPCSMWHCCHCVGG